MNVLPRSLAAAVACVAVVASTAACQAAEGKQPNVLLIYADDK